MIITYGYLDQYKIVDLSTILSYHVTIPVLRIVIKAGSRVSNVRLNSGVSSVRQNSIVDVVGQNSIAKQYEGEV